MNLENGMIPNALNPFSKGLPTYFKKFALYNPHA